MSWNLFPASLLFGQASPSRPDITLWDRFVQLPMWGQKGLPSDAQLWIKLGLAALVVILSYSAGRWLSGRLRMIDHGWKIGLVAFTLLAALVVTALGFPPKYGIDLKGGVVLVYQFKELGQYSDEALVAALRKRVDPSGTKQITVRLAGRGQVEIIVPDVGPDEVLEIKRNVTNLGTLEFRILADSKAESKMSEDPKKAAQESEQTRNVEEKYWPSKTEVRPEDATFKWVPLESIAPDDPAKADKVRRLSLFYSPQKHPDGPDFSNPVGTGGETRDRTNHVFTRVIRVVKDGPDELVMPRPTVEEIVDNAYRVEILTGNKRDDYVKVGPPPVGDGQLTLVGPDADEHGNPAVAFGFDTDGASKFGDLTRRFQPDRDGHRYHLAIVLNRDMTSAPTINSVITSRGQISGYSNTNIRERDNVIAVLKAGQLPAELEDEPLFQSTLDATLGADTVQRGLLSNLISLLAVMLFVLWYYRFSGIVACFALVTNLLLIIGAMIAIKAALTLPGLAGLVLTVGMAVDANVLIYERMREEIGRGASVRMAIRNGFAKAMSAIVDSNLTTIMTAIILYIVGTEQIRGFSVTLILGIAMSMFTAIFVARLIFDIAEKRGWLTELKMHKLLSNPNYDFLGKARLAITLSVIVIVVGLGAVYARGWSDLMAIDFTGGTSTQIVFKDVDREPNVPYNAPWVRQQLRAWNESVEQLGREELKTKLGEDATRTLVAQLATVLLEDRNEDVRSRVPFKKNELEGAEGINARLAASGALTSDEIAKLDKYYQDLSEAEFARLKELVTLEDAEVVPSQVQVADGSMEGRYRVETTNQISTAVKTVLARIFEGRLATETMTVAPVDQSKAAGGAPEKAEASGAKANEKPAEKPGDKAAPDKKAPDKAAPDKAAPDKAAPDKAAPDKAATDKAAPDKAATDKKATDKAAPAKTGSLSGDQGTYFVSAAGDGSNEGVLLAQAITEGKEAGSKKFATPAEKPLPEEGKAKAPQGPQYQLQFTDRISRVKVQNLLQRAASELKVSAIGIELKNPEFEEGHKENFKQWTVTVPLPKEQAERLLESAKQKLQSEPRFPEARKVETQVSQAMQQDGLFALLASLVGIVIYVWVRFQNVSFGLAAVVALVHDVLVTLGFIALSKYLIGIPTIDPFKINLDIVAAFLTIIGFSINDTIVIFDRIREIRGKAPEITWEMVNRSVNQTLSRTILTSLTVFMVVVVLYFFGGEGLHGFAFAMIVGLISGTYSTVYIASPVMLWLINRGKKKQAATQPQAARETQLYAGQTGS